VTIHVETCSHGRGRVSQLLVWRREGYLFTEHIFHDTWTRRTGREARDLLSEKYGYERRNLRFHFSWILT
jgi:hypothetical protein